MRNELTQIERIVAYVSGNMSPIEKTQFETELANDSALQREVQIQKDIMEGINRKALKAEMNSAQTKHIRNRNIKYSIVGAVIILGIIAIVNNIYNRYQRHQSHHNLDIIVDTVSTKGVELKKQLFEIDTRKDTVVVTKHGTVFAIPANAFESSSQSIVFSVQEAITPAEIIRAGLSTMADDKLLETGGMFNIQAYDSGKPVNISKEIIAETPTTVDSKNMKLFDGVVKADSTINWTNPQPIEQYLNTYEVTTLDFYPPRYFEGLQKRNLDVTNKTFTDSLYYSLEETDENITVKATSIEIPVRMPEGERYYPKDTPVYVEPPVSPKSKPTRFYHEVKPSQIRAIWNSEFNESLVATKEFEERLKVMHTACNGGSILNFYLENQEQELYKLDEKAANMDEGTTGLYRKFAAEKKGRVRPNEGLFKKLNDYYKEQKTIYSEAAKEARRKYLDENNQARIRAIQTEFKDRRERDSINGVFFNREFQTNLVEAYRQVGKPLNPAPPNTRRITWRVNRTGWKNLDQYVMESLAARKTLNYTDPETGKKAVIRFDTVNVNIAELETFDATRVYLIPKGYNSFIRLNEKDKKFTYNMNELLKYDLVIVAYKGEQAFSYTQQLIPTGEINTTLQPISNTDLDTLFATLSKENHVEEFNNQLEYLQSSIKEIKRSKDFAIKEELRRYIRPYALALCNEETNLK
jgi:hypothetical protein